MSKTTTSDEQAELAPTAVPQAAPAAAVATALPTASQILDILGDSVLPIIPWAQALAERAEFEETDEEDPSLAVVKSILLAATSDEVFAAMNVLSVKDLVGEEPGGRTNVFEIHGATPLKSTYEEGASCFAVIRAFDLAEQTPVTLSCGGRAVQAAILAHIVHGWLPVRVVFTRRRKATRRGFYPLNMERGI
jgi:hypothetical protein